MSDGDSSVLIIHLMLGRTSNGEPTRDPKMGNQVFFLSRRSSNHATVAADLYGADLRAVRGSLRQKSVEYLGDGSIFHQRRERITLFRLLSARLSNNSDPSKQESGRGHDFKTRPSRGLRETITFPFSTYYPIMNGYRKKTDGSLVRGFSMG